VEVTNQLETPAALCPTSAECGAWLNLYALKKASVPPVTEHVLPGPTSGSLVITHNEVPWHPA